MKDYKSIVTEVILGLFYAIFVLDKGDTLDYFFIAFDFLFVIPFDVYFTVKMRRKKRDGDRSQS